jgi:hypothetical protein
VQAFKVLIRGVAASSHVPCTDSSGHPFGPKLEFLQLLDILYFSQFSLFPILDPVVVIRLGNLRS